MPSLKEIKGRISSVQSTLKITSAMKLVASSKLRRAQNAIEGMRPYERQLQVILSRLCVQAKSAWFVPREQVRRVAVVAVASNSSLCGAFNANALRLTLETLRGLPQDVRVTVFSIGRKMAESMRKTGNPSPEDFTALSEKPSYDPAAALASRLMEGFEDGTYDQVLLVYNHFVSTARQTPVCETLLPLPVPEGTDPGLEREVILEPSAEELLRELLPKSVKLKLFSALLDSAAAEHAARTIAMQMATDNGNDLLQELTLQYNKSRQQKITSEILDLSGGQTDE